LLTNRIERFLFTVCVYGKNIYEFKSQKLQTVKGKKMDIDKNSIHTTHSITH